MILQALHRAAAVILQTVIDIVHTLGNMDMIAGAAVVGLYHAVEGLIGKGKQGVSSEHSRQHGILFLFTFRDKIRIFLYRLPALFFSVPVADLIA